MSHRYLEIAFTDTIKDLQQAAGSRAAYERMEQGRERGQVLGSKEIQFLAQRDSFYMASVSETGWPYVQHRGGPKGVMRVLDETTLGFADYSGNRQYMTTGNLLKEKRVSLFFMDYPNRRRLKMMGYATQLSSDDPRMALLEQPEYGAVIERGFVIEIAGFDWNCPQHITPRFDAEAVQAMMATLAQENQELKTRLAALEQRATQTEPLKKIEE